MLELFHRTSLQSMLNDLASPKEPEVYLVPPENVNEVLTAIHKTQATVIHRDGKNEALWALIAQLVPAVSADPSGHWNLQISDDLEVQIVHNA